MRFTKRGRYTVTAIAIIGFVLIIAGLILIQTKLFMPLETIGMLLILLANFIFDYRFKER